MAYPTVSAPYGLKPVNLIGGQVFSGSTRSLPIQYGYATNIFFGDFVVLSRGFVTRQAVTTSATNTAGIFLGCSFTNPVTKQKTFSQYWPTGTLAGDAVAIVCDDPDTVFKAAVCASASTTIGSSNIAMIGQNCGVVDNAGTVNTGDSAIAAVSVVAAGAPATTSTLPLRIVDVVRDTSVSVAATGSSSTTAITLTGSGLPSAVVAGTDVAYIAANGQLVETGSFLTTGYAAGTTTSIAMNLAIAVPGSVVSIPSSSTIVFTQYPEVLVKINFGSHGYYAATAV